MLKVLNDRNVEVNILHFQGRNIDILKRTFELVKNNAQLSPLEDDLSIVSCWTDIYKCHLLHQFNKFNLRLINAIPFNYDNSQRWDMTNKIRFYIDCLENKVNTKYVMLLDGYDVLFTSTKDIIKKFKKTGYRIIFNTSFNNFPFEDIDYIKDREKRVGFFPYFNAGCCIGYREDLIKFYKECLNFINVFNPLKSEQKILRHCFAQYSNDDTQNFIWLDVNRDIFHTMAFTKCNYTASDQILRIGNNIEGAMKFYNNPENLERKKQQENSEFIKNKFLYLLR